MTQKLGDLVSSPGDPSNMSKYHLLGDVALGTAVKVTVTPEGMVMFHSSWVELGPYWVVVVPSLTSTAFSLGPSAILRVRVDARAETAKQKKETTMHRKRKVRKLIHLLGIVSAIVLLSMVLSFMVVYLSFFPFQSETKHPWCRVTWLS
jgi:hypothetical protein